MVSFGTDKISFLLLPHTFTIVEEGKKGGNIVTKKVTIFILTGLNEALETVRKASISFPFGKGICGHVAETKETIYIKDAYNVSFMYFLCPYTTVSNGV